MNLFRSRTTTAIATHSMNGSPLRRAFLLLSLVLAYFALSVATQAQTNTKLGTKALSSVTTGTNDTALGYHALRKDTTGTNNTANGAYALENNTGGENTANGAYALQRNSNSYENTAIGAFALSANSTGSANTAIGDHALTNNTYGSDNTANGFCALQSNTTGYDNTAIGPFALSSTTGSENIALGSYAGTMLTTGSNNIDIGNLGAAAEENTIRIGTQGTQTVAYIAGIYGATVANGLGVVVDETGHIGTKGSSERFKQDIQSMDKASEAILALKPVTFRYKKELDPQGIRQFGLVAEEVEKVNSDLVVRDTEGKVYTVRYDAVNAMLLNEFLKEHRTVQELKSIVAKQEQEIEALTAGLQKVSDQLEMSQPVQTVANSY